MALTIDPNTGSITISQGDLVEIQKNLQLIFKSALGHQGDINSLQHFVNNIGEILHIDARYKKDD